MVTRWRDEVGAAPAGVPVDDEGVQAEVLDWLTEVVAARGWERPGYKPKETLLEVLKRMGVRIRQGHAQGDKNAMLNKDVKRVLNEQGQELEEAAGETEI